MLCGAKLTAQSFFLVLVAFFLFSVTLNCSLQCVSATNVWQKVCFRPQGQYLEKNSWSEFIVCNVEATFDVSVLKLNYLKDLSMLCVKEIEHFEDQVFWKGHPCKSQCLQQLITILTSSGASRGVFNVRFDHIHTHTGQTSRLQVNFVQSGNYFFLLFVHQEDNLYI